MGNYCYKIKKHHQHFDVLYHQNESCQPFMPQITDFNYLQSTGVQTKNDLLLLSSKSVQCSYSPELKRFTSPNKRNSMNQTHPISSGNKEELNCLIYEDKLTSSSSSGWKCISPHCNAKNNLFCKACNNLSDMKQMPKQYNEVYPTLSNTMTGGDNHNEHPMLHKSFEAGGDYKSTLINQTYPSNSCFHGVQTNTNESAEFNRFHPSIHYCSGIVRNNHQTSMPHLSYETCICKNSPSYHPITLYPHAFMNTTCYESKFLPKYIRNSEICLTQTNRKYLLDDYNTSNWNNFKRRNSMLLLKPFNDQCFSMDNINSVNYQDKLLHNSYPYSYYHHHHLHKPTIYQMNPSDYHITHNNEILDMNYNDNRKEKLTGQTMLRREHRSKSCDIPKSCQNLNTTVPCSRSYSLLSSRNLARSTTSQSIRTSRFEYVPPPSPVIRSTGQHYSRLNDEIKSSLNTTSCNDTQWLYHNNTPSLQSINNTKLNHATSYSQRFGDSNILYNINDMSPVYDIPECRYHTTPSSCYNLSHVIHQKYKMCKCFHCERHLCPRGDHHFMHCADSLQRLHSERQQQSQHHQHQQQGCKFMKSSTYSNQPVDYWLNNENPSIHNTMNHLDRKQNNPDISNSINKSTLYKPINSKVNHKTIHNSSSGGGSSVRSNGSGSGSRSHRQHQFSNTRRNSHSSRSPSQQHYDGTVKVIKSKVDLESTMNNLSSSHNYYTAQSFKHRFFLKDTCGIEKIISDPTDRRIRAICDRFRCDLEVYSKIPKNGYLQYVIDISSPNLWALHGCARALDSSLNWCLTPQLAV